MKILTVYFLIKFHLIVYHHFVEKFLINYFSNHPINNKILSRDALVKIFIYNDNRFTLATTTKPQL